MRRGPRPHHRLGDEGGAHPGALQRPGLDLRAQARRHPLHRDPRRRRGQAALAQRPLAQRPLPGASSPTSRRTRARASRSTARSSPSRARGRASRRLGHPDASIFYYVFDLLWLDGEDVRSRPLRERKAAPKGCSELSGPRPADGLPQRSGRGDVRRGVRQGLGGRDRQARRQPLHAPSARKDWLKFKCEQGQELVIGGFTAPRGSREEFGALLVGHFDRRRPALRRQGRHRLRPRDAQGPRRPHARAAPATPPRSPTRRTTATPPGSSRSSSPSSASPSGPPPAACATRVPRPALRQGRPARSSARLRRRLTSTRRRVRARRADPLHDARVRRRLWCSEQAAPCRH